MTKHWRLALLLVGLMAVLVLSGCTTTPVAGSSWPGVTTSGDTVYVAFQHVYAIDADGKMKWYFPHRQANASQVFYAAPAADDNLVVVADYVDSVFGLNPETGEAVWTFKSNLSRFISGPALTEKTVYAATVDGVLHAIDRTNGKELWHYQADGPIWSTPLVADGVVYFTSLDRHLYSVDAETGKLAWRFPAEGEGELIPGGLVGTPSLDDGTLYFGSLSKHAYALDIATRKLKWGTDTSNWVWSSPVFDSENGLLIGADLDGHVFGLDPATGKQIWTYDAGAAVVGAPLLSKLDDGTPVAYVTTSGEPNLFVLKTKDGTEARKPVDVKSDFKTVFLIIPTGTNTRSVPLHAAPVLFNDKLMVATDQGDFLLFSLKLPDLSDNWRFNATDEIKKATDAEKAASGQTGPFSDPSFFNTILLVTAGMLLIMLIMQRPQGRK